MWGLHQLQGQEDVVLVAVHPVLVDEPVVLLRVVDGQQPRPGGGDRIPGDLTRVKGVRLARPDLFHLAVDYYDVGRLDDHGGGGVVFVPQPGGVGERRDDRGGEDREAERPSDMTPTDHDTHLDREREFFPSRTYRNA